MDFLPGGFMVDGARVYRRWLLRRFALLVPGLLAAAGVVARLLASSHVPAWLKLPGVAAAGALALFLAHLGLQSVRSVLSASRGDLRNARAMRAELGLARGAALLSLLILPALLLLPRLFHPAAPERPLGPRLAIAAPRAELPPPPWSEPPLAEAPAPAEPQAPALPPAEPRIHPALAELPLTLALNDKDLAILPPLADDPPPPAPAPEATLSREDRQLPPFRSTLEDLLALPSPLPAPLSRPGLPDEGDRASWPAPELRLEVTIIPGSDSWHGTIYDASIEIPFGTSDSLELGGFAGTLGDEPHEMEQTLSWLRGSIAWSHHFLGWTRRAPVDFSTSVGLVFDRLGSHESEVLVSPYLRVAPWLGADLAFWERGGLGLLLHASHSFATRFGEHSAAVTDLSAHLRVDLSGSLSLSAGYRFLWLRLVDPLRDADSELSASFAGPTLGLDVRF